MCNRSSTTSTSPRTWRRCCKARRPLVLRSDVDVAHNLCGYLEGHFELFRDEISSLQVALRGGCWPMGKRCTSRPMEVGSTAGECYLTVAKDLT